MKVWQIISVLLLCLVLVGSAACNPFGGGNEEEVSRQLVEVVRGDLIVSISGSGNIEVANEAELTFGVGGKIDKIYVEKGDRVSKGDVLAQLDTGALELALTQAQVGVTQAHLTVIQAQVGVTQAQVALEVAKYNLDRMEDVAEAKDDITDAKYEVKIAEMRLKEINYLGGGDDSATQYWRTELILAQIKLAEAQADLAELLAEDKYASLVVDEVIIKQLQVKVAEESVEQARLTLEQAQRSVEQAQQSLEQAQKQLDEATITAPFGGIIASVSADEGDTVSTATTIVHLIDLTSIELKVEVDEIDIPSVKLGQKVIFEVDALPDFPLEGEVTLISLLPMIEAGIVSYEVTIGLNVSEDSELKVGMSATADVIIDERSNVLLVPNRAIKQDSQGNPVVKVMVNEQIQEMPVIIGISDGFQTEIISGLDEGGTVVIETRAKSEPSVPGLFSQ